MLSHTLVPVKLPQTASNTNDKCSKDEPHTSLATNSLAASCKVKGFPDCQLRQVLILLLNIHCCALRQELSQGSAIVQDVAIDLKTTMPQLAS